MTQGALAGLLSSFGTVLWLYLGATFSDVARYQAQSLPLYDICPNDTTVSQYDNWAQLNVTGKLINSVEEMSLEPYV